MGDASLPLAEPVLQRDGTPKIQETPSYSLREINVLVTGFGSFKSFTTNPSYLVAASLSRHLNPESESASAALKYLDKTGQSPICDPDPRPYTVNVTVYPEPVKVAYDSVGELIPLLVSDPNGTPTSISRDIPTGFVKPPKGFDYILHIGMAAGRDNYTLETLGHRDHYKLKDVDDKDGWQGEKAWTEEGVPEILHVGWNKEDVLVRWEALTRRREDEYEIDELKRGGLKEGMTLVEAARLKSQVFLGKGKRATVKLSRDAGRYLCEFIFFTSLATRWQEFRRNKTGASDTDLPIEREKLGKVAFLHVPGGTERHDIARGVRVAESAILALAGSWEDGYRNPTVYAGGEVARTQTTMMTSTTIGMYEAKGTGDR